jgi:hypothetical protein
MGELEIRTAYYTHMLRLLITNIFFLRMCYIKRPVFDYMREE